MRTSWWVDRAKEMGMIRMSGASGSVAEHSSADRQCLWRQSMHTPRRSVPYLQAALPRLAASRCFRVALALAPVCRVASIRYRMSAVARAVLALHVFVLKFLTYLDVKKASMAEA